ncbi:hypothetical protein PGT21_011210 [Puccinia graminis f. sp. tritici]|uniref:Uncharacterized protein n=1 Tax=Puccinia graminis f. sp. tritici TaxID=56615 RepID=A0A5B0NU43_PUCGR|nr:hypothetical protein PGT21_011210 [Puccinia graminis f. sp. tritici]
MINLMSVPHRIRNRPPKVTIPMNKLIASKTENVITQWPWTDNEAKLTAQGFRMVLNPHMRTPLEKLQNPSRSLKVVLDVLNLKNPALPTRLSPAQMVLVN